MNYQPNVNNRRAGDLGQTERLLSVLGGIGSVFAGLSTRNPISLFLIAAGGYLTFRGASGHCYITEALANAAGDSRRPQAEPYDKTEYGQIEYGSNDRNAQGDNDVYRYSSQTGQTVIPHGKGINVSKNITINRPVDDVYGFWRNFENLPRIMNHLEQVTVLDNNRSHWVAKAPLDTKVEWDAELITDEPNQRIAWRSLEGATVPNTGSVLFKPAYEGRGTAITVTLKYDPPGGGLGAAVAKLLGEEPSIQIQEDLYRFRQLMEAGEVTTVTGQTSGREKNKDLREQAAQNPTSIYRDSQ